MNRGFIHHPTIPNSALPLDGWAKSDVEYVWKDGNPVQLAANLSLPGGFKLGAYGPKMCDVVTATGENISGGIKNNFPLSREVSWI